METRRHFVDSFGRIGLLGILNSIMTACTSMRPEKPMAASEHFDLVVIGTGFGGTLSALKIAYTLDNKLSGRSAKDRLRILMLERGTWWTTPMETMQDKQVKTRDFLIRMNQPTQEWSALSDYRGMLELIGRCRYSERQPQGLYDFVPIGKDTFLKTVRNDGVSVLRASGVGGGSLIYSKILMRPPEELFDDPRWPGAWRGSAGAKIRNTYYGLALEGVTHGVVALMPGQEKETTGMTGPSNILTRAPGQQAAASPAPTSLGIPRSDSTRPLLQIRLQPDQKYLKEHESALIDRARIFQTALSQLTPYYGTVDLSINDSDFSTVNKRTGATLKKPGFNVCERHGRCNIGCLPGAGQTLNKQLFTALYGKVDVRDISPEPAADAACTFKNLSFELRALAHTDYISERSSGGYLIHYRQRPAADPTATPDNVLISADRVIVAAGSLGTSELMLRSRQRSLESGGAEGLSGLSAYLGNNFSPNGDHLAFLSDTKERINLTYGPVTTSFGQFNAHAPMATGFHNIEDQGIPRSLASTAAHGVALFQRLAQDDGVDAYVKILSGVLQARHDIFSKRPERNYPAKSATDLSGDRPASEDELVSRTMCIVAQAKDDANGRFTLENNQLRLHRTDGKRFHEDQAYENIRITLGKLAEKLRRSDSDAEFISPLSGKPLPPGIKPTVMTSHPLGGCPMGATAESGVVDEWGRVYRTRAGQSGFYRGLYIADGSVVPTALGVNPSLTISAIALRVADKILSEWDQIPITGEKSAPARSQCLLPAKTV